MVFKWNEQDTVLFLDNFKKYPCLWNHKIDEYKDKRQRAFAMTSLIKDLNIDELTEQDIKRKIKTIRTRYTSELGRIKQSTISGCSTAHSYLPTLYWFKNAEFLSSVCVPRQSACNNKQSKTDQMSDVSQSELCDGLSEYSEADQQAHDNQNECFVKMEQDTIQTANAEGELATNEGTNGPRIAYYSSIPTKRKRINETHDVYVKTKNKRYKEQEVWENEFDLFCRSLAVQLKKMPLDKALICQEKLLSVMVRERLAHIRTNLQTRPEYVAYYEDSSNPTPEPTSFEYDGQLPH